MSIRSPLFLKVEEFTFQGRNTGVYYNLHKHANRARVTRLATEIAGWNLADARRLSFAAWLVELRIVSDEPDVLPIPTRVAVPSRFECWWQYGNGFSQRALSGAR
jgi:hypothetical protein